MLNQQKSVLDPKLVSLVVEKTKRLPWIANLVDEYVQLINFCDDMPEVELVNKLLDHFVVVDSGRLDRTGKSIVASLKETHQISPDDTLFYAFSDSDVSDGSETFLYSLKNKFDRSSGWRETHFISNLMKINEHKSQFTKVILVDDFIGTGNTTVRKVNYVRDALKKLGFEECEIIVICIAAMNFSKAVLDAANIKVIAGEWLRKGIAEQLPESEKTENYRLMDQIERRFDQSRHKKFFPYGYGQSEALFSLEGYNTPNNVFPVFWFPHTLLGSRNTLLKALR